jgi:1,4-dihydroxy-2-naphthoyl-CoA hydrolase
VSETKPRIWKQPTTVAAINAQADNTLAGTLGMAVTELGDDFIRGTMPVDARTMQPYGLLHGGASVALAETLGSVAANLCLDPATHMAVGLEINANHLRAVRSGSVTGTARPLHIGRQTQVWEIRIADERGRAVCVSRLTLAVVERPR